MHERPGVLTTAPNRRLLVVILTLILALVSVTACSHQGRTTAPVSTLAPTASSSVATGIPSTSGSKVPPPAPGTLAADARASTVLVVQLHDTAMMLARDTGLPPGTMTAQAADLQRQFRDLSSDVDSATPLGTQLVSQLRRYAAVAAGLGNARPISIASVRSTLSVLDAQWRATVKQIDQQTGQNLLASLPPLLTPSAVAAVPSPR
jgi:hypothetical protein